MFLAVMVVERWTAWCRPKRARADIMLGGGWSVDGVCAVAIDLEATGVALPWCPGPESNRYTVSGERF
jgi:hypothetical protein